MKKTKSSGWNVGLLQPESNSVSQSHPEENDEFKDFPPLPTLDTHDFLAKEEDEERENATFEDGDEEDEEEDEDDDEEDDEEGEEEEEDDDDDVEEGEEQDEEAEEREADALEGAAEGKVIVDRKKLADGFFEVESIRRKRICKGERQYLIKWRGWPESANTWEPIDHLQTCPDVVEAFEESLRSGKKKSSRKRKRKFTQPKKKMQYPYGVSKKHEESMKGPRAAKDIDRKSFENVSRQNGSNEKENGAQFLSQNTSGKNMDVHFQQPVTVEGDGPANCQSNANCVDVDQTNQRRGAKRRKSGSVRRFTQDMTSLGFDYYANATPANISSCDRVEELMLGKSDGYHKKKFESSRSSSVITRLIKAISYSASVTNNVQDVSVTFVAMRSDGKEVMVDNKFLKANNPLLLINYYEQRLRHIPN